MRRNLNVNSVAAIALISYVVLFLTVTTIAIPELDTMASVDRFFLVTWAGVIGGKIMFLVLLVREIDYYASKLGQALILILFFVTMLGCFYLYFNARMGTGIFA